MKVDFKFKGVVYNSKKKQNIEECMEFVLNHTYGETLLNNELAKILGYNIEDELEYRKFKTMMSRIKEYCIDYGYVLKNISHVGFYILKPQHITSHCYRTYIKKSQRTLSKSLYVQEHVDTTELSEERMEEYNKFIEMNESLIESTEKLINNSPYFNRMDYYNSLKD